MDKDGRLRVLAALWPAHHRKDEWQHGECPYGMCSAVPVPLRPYFARPQAYLLGPYPPSQILVAEKNYTADVASTTYFHTTGLDEKNGIL